MTFTTRTVYGRPLFYPADQLAQAVASIAGKKTLSKPDIAQLQAAGFAITLQPDPAFARAE